VRIALSHEATQFEREAKSLPDEGDPPIVYRVNLY
jgi:hypothetical protein